MASYFVCSFLLSSGIKLILLLVVQYVRRFSEPGVKNRFVNYTFYVGVSWLFLFLELLYHVEGYR